ncbi:MAG: LEA type 2 family protein [Woeseiaceae bacterium]
MNGVTGFKNIGLGAVACILTGCASTGSLVESPHVTLRDVKVAEIDLDSQTFLLDFDVTNPNPFPLPISAISYGVELDGFRFASGETQGDFTFPASSDGGFSISVELNLMRTAPQLLFIVRDGVQRDIPYALTGTFDVDIPFMNAVNFKTSGTIRLHSAEIAAEHRH